MNDKQRLIKEIEQAPDVLIREVLNFLRSTKNRAEKETQMDVNWETQLKEMAEDKEIQAEIKNINREFSVAEMDGLT